MAGAAAEQTVAPEAIADFLREVRYGVEAGLDPLDAAEDATATLPARLRTAVEGIAVRLRGDSRADEWGFDEQLAEAVYPVFELLYDSWWRVRTHGVRNVPAHGRALLVPNHTGSMFPLDPAIVTVAIMRRHPLPRWPRFTAGSTTLAVPLVSTLVRACGGVPAGSAAPLALLDAEEPVTVFPEGLRGVVKPYSERHRVQGFADEAVAPAIETGAPIVPVAITGPAQLYPLGVTPPGSCWEIEFCEPIAPPPNSPDPWAVGDLAAQVRERIQERIDRRVLRAAIPGPPG